MALDIGKIIKYPLPLFCYNQTEVHKNQIVIHHTAGNSNPFVTIDGWKSRTDKVCTPYVIGGKFSSSPNHVWKDGDILQAFDEKDWAYHLGLSQKHFIPLGLPYKELNSPAIAIEVCNWGCLTKDAGGNFRNYVQGIVPSEEVTTLDTPFRGYNYYHSYTDAQIASLKDLLIYLCDKYGIPKTFNANMFDVNKDAMSGKSGIFTHTSYRTDKSDCAPQPKLIAMLKSLSV